jgi:hypothetical protein
MYKTTNEGIPTPTANIAINNSRIKLYGKTSEVPTYYLQKGQEFQIELHNPTKDTIMAKISLNGNSIAQGGVVLKPAQRVFLDRYIDVAKKFKFDTYEVTNSSTNRKAIEDNGDFKVDFYKESVPVNYNPIVTPSNDWWGGTYKSNCFGVTNINNTTTCSVSNYSADNIPTMTFMDQNLERNIEPRSMLRRKKVLKSKKNIETGRVEQGSESKQTLTTVYINWEYTPFHSIEYKMKPVSQKVSTVGDIKVKRYCTNCGSKQKPNFKFCPSCGTKA